jgi:hypothetical protein
MKQANQVATYINAIASHIKAGKTLKQALEALTPVFDRSSVEDQQAITLQIAQFIGKEYGVKPITTNRGGVSFDRKTKKGDAARKMMSYYFPTVNVGKAKPKTSKQVDKVAVAIKSLCNRFSKAELKRIANGIA